MERIIFCGGKPFVTKLTDDTSVTFTGKELLVYHNGNPVTAVPAKHGDCFKFDNYAVSPRVTKLSRGNRICYWLGFRDPATWARSYADFQARCGRIEKAYDNDDPLGYQFTFRNGHYAFLLGKDKKSGELTVPLLAWVSDNISDKVQRGDDESVLREMLRNVQAYRKVNCHIDFLTLA